MILFIVLNLISAFHAYRFTHFDNSLVKTTNPENLNLLEKTIILFCGISNPKPLNVLKPKHCKAYLLQSNKKIEIWEQKTNSKSIKGTIILFHGYRGCKSLLLDKSSEFLNLGYNTVVVDFIGSGGSEGIQTTVGYREAQNVKTVFDFVKSTHEENIYLFGTSMGAVSILKALADYELKPKGIILECPFGSMYKTTCARFSKMKIPSFPMAGLLVFWGGILNGYWAFGQNPTEYAKSVKCPMLLLYGAKDKEVSNGEIKEIYHNVKGIKVLKIFKNAGHENYLNGNKNEWLVSVKEFLVLSK